MKKKIRQFLFFVLRFVIISTIALFCLSLSCLIVYFSFKYSAHIIYTFYAFYACFIVFFIALLSGIAFSITIAGFVLSIVELPDYLKKLRPWDKEKLNDNLIKLNNNISSISLNLYDIKNCLETHTILNLSLQEYINSIQANLNNGYNLISKLICVAKKYTDIGDPKTKKLLYKIYSNILNLQNLTSTLKDTFECEHQISQALNSTLKDLYSFTQKSNSRNLVKHNLFIVKYTTALINRNSNVAISEMMEIVKSLNCEIKEISHLIRGIL